MDYVNAVFFAGAGAVFGALTCYLIFSRRTDNLMEEQLKDTQEEFTLYRENVNKHFEQTAKLVNNLTEDYVAVHKHLKSAAEDFAQPTRSLKLQETTPVNWLEKPVFNALGDNAEPASNPETEDSAHTSIEPMASPEDYTSEQDLIDDYRENKPITKEI